MFKKFFLFYTFVFSFALLIPLSLTVQAQTLAKIDTTLTDKVTGNDDPVGQKDVFNKDTTMIYVTWKSDQVKRGQNIKAVWIADDTNNAAPPNYKIAEKGTAIEDGLIGKVATYWTGKFTLSRPTAGWPLGKYHVDIYLDNQLIKTVKFSIQ